VSRQKVAAILALNEPDRAAWVIKRQLMVHWRQLDHKDWVKFCKQMATWFSKDAPDEWDKYTQANKERKAKSDAAALKKVLAERA